ncbi:salt stress protein, Slr1339 family [Synechocystis sp. PCC 7338]|uniref:salt stress protein, Slr1339 family n=1 Tax=Synechocystis sp. PCC 7338 TaxID=2732530 RepID=UPI0035302F88
MYTVGGWHRFFPNSFHTLCPNLSNLCYRILNELKQGFKINYFPEKTNQIPTIIKESPQVLNPELKNLIDRQEQQRQAIIAQKAQQWLDQLDPLSGEGIWFADLAKHYPSTLAAAIALLNNEST